MPLDDAYQQFTRAIESANVVIETCRDPILGDVQVEPGKVCVLLCPEYESSAY